jgi:O-antigen/teichoic acid export membrane protein
LPGEVAESVERPTDPVARGSATLFWAQVLGNAGLFAALVAITRALGPSGRGTVAFITVTAIVSASLVRFGITEATTVFVAKRPRVRSTLLGNVVLSVTVASVAAALVVCGAMLAAPALRPPGVGDPELLVLAVAMLASGLTDAGYMFVLGCSRFRFHAAVTIVSAWLYAATIAADEVIFGLTPLRALVIWAALQAVKALVLLWASIRAEGIGKPQLPLLREAARFGLGAWVGSLSNAFSDRLDQILVALIASEATLGIYATAVNSFEILLYLAAAAATAMLPAISRAAPEARGERVMRAFRSVALLTVCGTVVAAVAGTHLIPIVFGRPFEAAREPFLWLLPAALGFVALSVFSSALLGSSAPRRSSAGPVVSLVVGIVLDFVLIDDLGATGAAVATSAGALAGGVTALVLYRLRDPFTLRALLVPRRGDLELLGALAKPFARAGGAARR